MLKRQIKRAIRDPFGLSRFIVKKFKEVLLWDYIYDSLPEPKVKKGYNSNPTIEHEIIGDLGKSKFEIVNFEIDVNDYYQYIKDANYVSFPYYCDAAKENFLQKSLQHYLAAKLLGLTRDDVYVDVACANSPASEIYHRLYGCKVYRQDLEFPEGIHGNVIGGNAGNMPLEDESVTKMALHCSFEHFEKNSDIEFIREANRVLCKGGKLCIVPLYLSNKYVVQTDPSILPFGGISFENDAILYCAKGWGARHARFYDVHHLIKRIRNNLNGFRLKIYVVQNGKEVTPSCYTKFIAVFEKI